MCSVICQIQEHKRTPWAQATYERKKVLATTKERRLRVAEVFMRKISLALQDGLDSHRSQISFSNRGR